MSLNGNEDPHSPPYQLEAAQTGAMELYEPLCIWVSPVSMTDEKAAEASFWDGNGG